MIGTNADGLMEPCLEPEALLNLNDPSKYPVPLFDIGQPHHLTHSDGLNAICFPFRTILVWPVTLAPTVISSCLVNGVLTTIIWGDWVMFTAITWP